MGCYGCMSIFPAKSIDDWTDNNQTAICGCLIDAVLPDATVSFDEKLLRRLHDYFFGWD